MVPGEPRRVTVRLNGEQPPLPFADASFDLAFSVSVHTHLAESSAGTWTDELGRVIAPGGILLVTTHGYPALRIIRDTDTHQAMFKVSQAWADETLGSFAQMGYVGRDARLAGHLRAAARPVVGNGAAVRARTEVVRTGA
jgi:SAM-dependent methyltransferase